MATAIDLVQTRLGLGRSAACTFLESQLSFPTQLTKGILKRHVHGKTVSEFYDISTLPDIMLISLSNNMFGYKSTI